MYIPLISFHGAVGRVEFRLVAFFASWRLVGWNFASAFFWLRSSWSVGISPRLILLLGGWTVEILLCRVFGFVISLSRVRPRLLFHFPILIFCCRGRGLNLLFFFVESLLFSLVRPG